MLVVDETIQGNESKLADLNRKHIAMCEQLHEAAGQASKIRVVRSLQSVLEDYKSELLKRKISQIEETVSHCFNTLCRKKDTLRRVELTLELSQ